MIGLRSARGGSPGAFTIVASAAAIVAAWPGDSRADDAPKPSKLRIAGALGNDPTVKRKAPTANVDERLVIESNVNESIRVSVRVGPFLDPKGVSTTAAAKLDGGDQLETTLKPFGSASLSIAATLPAEAEYTAEISLGYDEKAYPVKLVVTHASEVLPVSFLSLDPVRADADTFGSSTARLTVGLQEASGRAIQLKVALTSFTAKEGAASYAAHGELEPYANGSRTKEVSIQGNQVLAVPLVIQNIDGAGEYTGTLHISADGMSPVAKQFTLVLREPRQTAIFCIFIGSLLAMILHIVVTQLRPRLMVERRLELLARQLQQRLDDPLVDEDARALLWELSYAVQMLRDAVSSRVAAKPETTADVLEKKRELADVWIQRRRQLQGIELPEARREITAALESARDELASAVATPSSIQTQRIGLDALPSKTNEALRTALETRLETMRTDVDAAVADPSRAIGMAAATQIVPLLEEAKRALAQPDLPAALTAYKRARADWLVLLLEDLANLKNGPPADGVDTASWKVVVETIVADVDAARAQIEKDPDAALQRYRSAQARYLASVAEGLGRAIDELKANVAKATPDEKVRTLRLAALDQAASMAGEARKAVVMRKLDESASLLAEARRQWLKVRDEVLPPRLGSEAAETVRLVPTVPGDLTGPRPVASVAGLFEQAPPKTGKIWFINAVLALMSLAVAALVGVTVLWEAHPTWGGARDHIAAMLWGLGLHGATFSGVSAVAEKLLGKRTET